MLLHRSISLTKKSMVPVASSASIVVLKRDLVVGRKIERLEAGRYRLFHKSAPNDKSRQPAACRKIQRIAIVNSGAGEGIRTLDPDLGKVVLYH
jgi:hypothetical protein